MKSQSFNRRTWTIIRSPLIAIFAGLLASGGTAFAQPCDLHPIALPASVVANAPVNSILPDIFQGTEPGNFGWLTWAGGPSVPTLVASLSPPGDSHTYVNPDDSSDHQISVGEWVRGKPGVSNSKNVRDALDALKQIDITVPVWSETRGQGANADYRVSAFARVRLLSYQLPGKNRITARFLGYVTCDQQNFAPVVSAGPDQTIQLPMGATLQGAGSDDGLPAGSALTVSWTQQSGAGTVTFADSAATNTAATFSAPGTYVLRLTATDGLLSASDDVIVTVDRPNTSPQALGQFLVSDEDTPLPIVLQGQDAESDPLSFVVVTDPSHGGLTGIPPNVVYMPDPDFNGSDSFAFKTSDGALESAPATVTITLRAVDDAPVADSLFVTNLEDTAGPVVLSGADMEGSPLTFILLTAPIHGTLNAPPGLLATNELEYAPAPNFQGTDSFTYKVNDGALDSLIATVTIHVVSVNDAPVVDAGADQFISLPANNITLAGLVMDDLFDGALLTTTWSSLSGPGTVTFADPASTNTTATFSASGVYVLRLTADDLFLTAGDELTVTINAPPHVSAGTNQIVTLPDIVRLAGAASDDSLPTNGTLVVAWSKASGPGAVVFADPSATNTTATFGESGIYALRLTASDSVTTATNDVTVTINRAPIVDAGSDQFLNALTTTLAGSVADDGLPEGVAAAPLWIKVSGPGEVTFDSASDPATAVTFSTNGVYVLRLSADDSLAATSDEVTITINGAPLVDAQALLTDEDTPLPVTLTGMDAENDPLTFAVVSPPLSGVLSGTSPNLIYTPDANFNGVDSFLYVANDGELDSASALVIIDVLPVNDPPAAIPQTISALEDAPVNILIAGTDIDGDPLNFIIATPPNHGSLSGTAPSLVYTATLNYHGPDAFTFAVTDGLETSPPALVSITVEAVNDAPVANARLVETDQDTPVNIVLTGSDVDGDAIIFLIVTPPGHGVLSGAAPGVTYTPENGFSGSDSFAFAVNDGQVNSAPGTVTINVTQGESGDFMADAGPDQVVTSSSVMLAGAVNIPTPAVGTATNVLWSEASGTGTVQFASPTAFDTEATFAEPGTYTLKLLVNYDGGQRSDTLTVVVLPQVPERLSSARSSRGSDFWLTFLDNGHPFGEPGHSGLSFAVTTEADTTGVVSFYGQGEWHTNYFEVQAGSPTIVPIADYWSDPTLAYSDAIQDNAIHISTAGEVTVYALNFLDFTTDGYLALPTSLLGTEYIVLGFKNSPAVNNPDEPIGGTQFAVVATENETLVTITPTLTTDSRMAGVPFQITLQQGQTYRLMNLDSLTGDLSGSTILADKPVAVFGGHQCANVPAGFLACDHLVEQLPPVNLWSRQFVTMPLATRSGGDTFRILAMADNTLVAVNGEVVANLNRGQIHERTNSVPSQIISSQPVLVAQYANGSTFDASTGDPFMMLVPPAEQFGGSYTLATPQVFDYWAFQYADIFTNYLTLIVRTNSVNAIQLDGEPVPASLFQPIGNSGYSGAQVAVSPGTRRLTANVPFGVSLYGWAQFESYACIGGIYSESIEADTLLALQQSSDRSLVGTEKIVTATVTNGRQRPLAGVEVTFNVTGANTLARRVRTNPFGEAVFAYTATDAGEDVIQAVVVGLQQSITNIWLQSSDNLPPTVDPGASQFVALNQITHLAATVADDGKPVGGTLTYQWRTASGHAPARFTQPNQPVTEVSFDLPGVYQLELTVSDSMLSVRSNVTISVNDVPRVRSLWSYPFEQHYSVGQTVTLLAQVSDSDGRVTNVEFFDGELKIGETGPPGEGGIASIDWVFSQPGNHPITVLVTDDLGGAARSAPLAIRVASPPLVEWINPTNLFEAIAGVPLSININASDLDGIVTNVVVVVDYYTPNYERAEFTAIGTGPNYTGSWTPPRAGDYYFYAYAWDDDGAAGVAGIYVHVEAPVPTVSLQAHLPSSEHGALVGYPLLLAAEVTVVEPVQIGRVEFYQGSSLIGSITNGPYLLTYVPTNPGPYSFTARAFTEVGSSGDSAPVSVTPVPFLKVLWEDPRETEWVPLGSTRLLSVRLQDLGGIFSNVTFLVNGQPLATTDFTFVEWTPTAAGDHTLQARVTDSFGNSYLNEALVLRVAELQAPDVQILEPVNGARFAAGMPVNFLAEATDSDNAVTNLSLHLYSAAEFGMTGSSLSYSWHGLPPGEHEFTATATDNTGQKGEARVRVIVEPQFNAGLAAPQNLLAQPLGCNAIRISWNHPSTDTNEVVAVERAIGASEVWEAVGYLLTEESFMENHGLTPMTTYRYRAYLRSETGERSAFSNQANATTRPYLPNYAVLDLTESLVDEGVATPISARLKRRSPGRIPADYERILVRSSAFRRLGAPLAKAETPWHAREFKVPMRDSRIVKARHELRRVNNGSPLDLGLTAAFGLSDNNEVLLLDPLNTANPTTFLWRPNAESLEFDRGAFEPYRLADLGAIVGANLESVQDSQGQTIQRWHAGAWVGTFLDLTPDVAALRIPTGHPPHPEPYPTLNALLDLSRAGFGVGLATWLYFPDEDPNSAPLTSVNHATLWPANGEPPVSFGSLEQLNNESGFWAINEAGDIVGQSRLFDPARPTVPVTHAVRSHVLLASSQLNDKLVDLGTLGGDFSAALALNQAGTAVGYSTLNVGDPINQTHAVYWLRDDLSPQQLPGFGPANHSYAWDIDDRQNIIGQAIPTDAVNVAAMWRPAPAAPHGYSLLDLNDYTSNPKWFLTSAQFINTNGFIVGSGLHSRSSFINGERFESGPSPRTYLLVPNVSLAVDYNRDGRIELNDKDSLPVGQPYQFWVNDDTDDADVGRDRVPHAVSDPDYSNSHVDGRQDLTDWFPVFLNISNLLALLPPDANEYRLIHAEAALNFLHTDLTPDSSGRYLTNDMSSGFGVDLSQAPARADGVQLINSHGVALSSEFLSRIRQQGRGVILVEARKATSQPLRLEVRNTRRVVATVDLPLSIGNVEDMYAWYNMRFVIGEQAGLPTDLTPSNAPRFADPAASFVFLHGYNVNELQSRDWSIEMFKRMWWSGSVRKFYAVSWVGDTTQIGPVTINYHLNVQQAIATAPAFARFLSSPMLAGDVTVAAHSLGNMVVSPAIQDHGARPTRYLMVDCAVAMEAYDGGLPKEPAMTHPDWRSYTNRLYATEWHTLFPDSDGRNGLTWRGRFKDVHKLTKLYNFYSSGEEVLENNAMDNKPMITDVLGQQGFSILPGTLPWALQELLKGRVTASDFYALYAVGGLALDTFLLYAGVRGGNVVGSKYGGWGFNPYWDTSGSSRTVTVQGQSMLIYESGGRRPPASALQITGPELRTNSFFLTFLNEHMYEPVGNLLASDPIIRTRLLAEAIPVLTFAAGANAFPDGQPIRRRAQFDMNSVFQLKGWPVERLSNGRKQNRWFHSDVRDIPHVYNGDVFKKWVELGGAR